MAATASARLITIPISHYCEKARWALDRGGIAYTEHAHVQFLHYLPARLAGGGRTVPVVVAADGQVIADSTDVLRWVDQQGGAPPLFPEPGAARAEIETLTRDFDTDLGPPGRRWMYSYILHERELCRDYGLTGVPAWQRRSFPVAFPAIRGFLRWLTDASDESRDAARAAVDRIFERVGTLLADGRPFLVGERLTAADLTFAALSAAVLMPPEYGVPVPQPGELPPAMGQQVLAWREHAAGRFALRLYAEERERPLPGRSARSHHGSADCSWT